MPQQQQGKMPAGNIYNHRPMVPAAAQPQAVPPQSMVSQPGGPPQGPGVPGSITGSTARLNDLFEAIKAEFENVGQDISMYKMQRDDMEQKCKCSTYWVTELLICY